MKDPIMRLVRVLIDSQAVGDAPFIDDGGGLHIDGIFGVERLEKLLGVLDITTVKDKARVFLDPLTNEKLTDVRLSAYARQTVSKEWFLDINVLGPRQGDEVTLCSCPINSWSFAKELEAKFNAISIGHVG